jgi:hypothetical protein
LTTKLGTNSALSNFSERTSHHTPSCRIHGVRMVARLPTETLSTVLGKTRPGTTRSALAAYKLRRRVFDTSGWIPVASSSAELSEAINSMFRWYREAEICFAYLEDVPSELLISEWSTAEIRWFSRGWTLQELLAPCQVEFYATNWAFLGTRSDHCGVLSQITGIHEHALLYQNLEGFSIAQRMSWASSRTTTRPEDLAYCLLGLFDVNLPLLYGEGGKRAFLRLQEEIMRGSDDHTIFAWTQRHVEPQKMHGLLADLPADFALAANIVPRGDLQVSNPYSVTNSGLQITLPITQGRPLSFLLSHPKGYVAFLDCVDENYRDKWVTLRLIRLSPQSDQYTRYNLNEIEHRDTREKVESASKRIFVRSRVKENLGSLTSNHKPQLELNFSVSNANSGYYR